MVKFFLLALLAQLTVGFPLEGFGDATDEEIEQIRAGTYLEMFDENPTYNYNYKVADSEEQTYVALEESRQDNVVSGTYSYVDPTGSLITVRYSAGPMGYTEERTEERGFVQIIPRPVSISSGPTSSSSSAGSSPGQFNGVSFSTISSGPSSSLGSSSLSSGSSSSSGSTSLSSGSSSLGSSGLSSSSSSSFGDSSLIETILTQIRPLISETVSSAVSGQSSLSSTSGQSSSLSSSGQTVSSLPSSSFSPVQDSLLILRPGSSPTPSTSSSSSSDLVAQIVSQISPLVSQTVSSVVDANSQSTRTQTVRGQNRRLQIPQIQTLDTSATVSDTQSLFGSGGHNVQINHAGATIEY